MEGVPPDKAGVGLHKPHKTLKFRSPGPKYLVISRVPSTAGDPTSLSAVSPFLIKKVIASTCTGEVNLRKKLRNGTILLQTKTVNQASKLINLTSLSPTIKVDVSELNSLNCAKGLIYSNSLRGINEEEILHESKDQFVINVHKILKKNISNELNETGLIVLTFDSVALPDYVYIGYERVSVRIYTPLPLRCNNCLAYGHISKYCKNSKICSECGDSFHIDKESNEICHNTKSCNNCKEISNADFNHSHSCHRLLS